MCWAGTTELSLLGSCASMLTAADFPLLAVVWSLLTNTLVLYSNEQKLPFILNSPKEIEL